MNAALVALLWVLAAGQGEEWHHDPVWHDGLVEKAVYTASRPIYGRNRVYEAIFFTNKEVHDPATQTKSPNGRGFEAWKFNQVEVIPTPNYDYKYVTTTHQTVDGLRLTRHESSSQEFCGTSFKQYQSAGGEISYWSFSYMPGAGRVQATISADEGVVPEDSLPHFLRFYDFAARPEIRLSLLPSQKSNRATDWKPAAAVVRHVATEPQGHRLELVLGGNVRGTYWMAPDRGHVMTRYAGADGTRYELKNVERVDYWTIRGE
jgi:hypothetical protein